MNSARVGSKIWNDPDVQLIRHAVARLFWRVVPHQPKWVVHHWAPGHSSDRAICKRCGRLQERIMSLEWDVNGTPIYPEDVPEATEPRLPRSHRLPDLQQLRDEYNERHRERMAEFRRKYGVEAPSLETGHEEEL